MHFGGKDYGFKREVKSIGILFSRTTIRVGRNNI